MRWGMTRSAGKVRFRSHIAAIATACLLNLSGPVWADVGATQQNFVDGKITWDGIDLFYRVVGPTSGDYVLVLSGGENGSATSARLRNDRRARCVLHTGYSK